MNLTIYTLAGTVRAEQKHNVNCYKVASARRWPLLVAFFTGVLKLHRGDAEVGPLHIENTYDIHGNPIKGLKRCLYCGLSETYWGRFPVCENSPYN
jgi:hypothetical protein